MKKFISFLFGKPFKKVRTFKAKYFRFMYWAMISFYFLSLTMLLINIIVTRTMEAVFALIFGFFFFPISFRIVFGIVGKWNGVERETAL